MPTTPNTTLPQPTKPGDPCLNCGRATVKITPDTLAEMIETIRPNLKSVTGPITRKKERYYLICPYCDAYGLGAELQAGFPFADQDGYTHTIHDLTDW